MSLDVEVARVIDATPEEAFDAFTNPEGQDAFYGQDDPGWIVQSQCDLRVGGVWTVDFGPSRRELYRHRHIFEAIERPHRLALTCTETRLDGTTLHIRIEITFETLGEKTLMTMTQRGIPTAELRKDHERGVPNAIARLERTIVASRTAIDTHRNPAP
jgi:uncharacterized protein YndB with AHSA1/START domain